MFRFSVVLLSLIGPVCVALAQSSPAPRGTIPLDSLQAFTASGPGWQIAGGLASDPRHDVMLAPLPGVGVLIGNPAGPARTALSTKGEFDDAVLDVDFLLTPAADAVVYLQGRYGVHLADGRSAQAALADAGRAPGLWQHLHIEFIAPRFDSAGKKSAPARFAKIVLNGFTIHQDVALRGPMADAPLTGEAARGPLVLAGGRGAIAVRGLQLSPPRSPNSSATAPAPAKGKGTAKKAQKAAPKITHIPVDVTDAIILQRGFVPYEPKKRLYATSVGTPAGVHYAYDFETGALLRVWRGRFIDAGEMWEGRSPNQIAKPTGPALTLNALPTLAVSGSGDWPVEADPLAASHGYEVERDGQPVFLSTYATLAVRDRIAPSDDRRGLTRTLSFAGAPPAAAPHVLLVRAKTIKAQPDGTGYIVGDRDFYIDLPSAMRGRATVRTAGEHQLLVIPFDAAALAQPISYSLVW